MTRCLLALLWSCSTGGPAPETDTDAWIGQWNGPEGTWLRIEPKPGTPAIYTVTIADLDGPEQFEGVARGDTIVFTRDGVAETLRAGDGQATGMKWLADKKDCLLVKAGEGWCREP